MAAGNDRFQAMREFVNDVAERVHLPPVFWEPPIDYRQDNQADGDGRSVLDELRPRARFLYGTALTASLVLHGALLGYALNHAYSSDPLSGASVVSTAAISVELTDSRVLKSLKNDTASEAALATAAMPKGGEPSSPASRDETKPEPVAESAGPPPVPSLASPSVTETVPQEPEQVAAAEPSGGAETLPVLAVSDPQAEMPPPAAPAPETADATPAPAPPVEVANATPIPTPRAQPDADAEKPARHPSRRDARKPASAPGAMAAFEATGSSLEARSAGRATASRGQTVAYRSRVQAHLAANKPSGGLGSGTVKVAFALSVGGDLISARVVHSSGNRTLDQAALAAVRDATPYPEPPTGISPSQLRFSFPFYFR